jgi:tRNA (cytidine/uridine-2'-O-)-methyltransferase
VYNIKLFQPDIPQNTVATIRLCACLNANLEIIELCRFQLSEKKLKSIFMDYYKKCKIIRHLSFEDIIETKNKKRIILLTTKAKNLL